MTTWPANHCGMPRGTQQVPLKGDITVMTYNPGSIHKRPYCRQLFNRNGNSYGSGFVVVYISRHKYINCWISAHNKVLSPNWLEWLFCVAGAGQYAYEMLHDKQFVAKTIWGGGGVQSGSWESLLWLNENMFEIDWCQFVEKTCCVIYQCAQIMRRVAETTWHNVYTLLICYGLK